MQQLRISGEHPKPPTRSIQASCQRYLTSKKTNMLICTTQSQVFQNRTHKVPSLMFHSYLLSIYSLDAALRLKQLAARPPAQKSRAAKSKASAVHRMPFRSSNGKGEDWAKAPMPVLIQNGSGPEVSEKIQPSAAAEIKSTIFL